MNKLLSRFILVTSILLFASVKARQSAEDEAARLVSAMLGDTPIVADLRQLTDEIGGRATGSEANLKSVEWALAKFKEAGVEARKEGFMMPALWRERSVKIEITGAANFSPAAACMPFSSGTPATGLTAALIDGGFGADDDFKRLGAAAKGAFVLIETHELLDLEGLFKEYNEGARIEKRAFAAGVAGVVYTGSRPRNVLYRHNASLGYNNEHPLLVMERDAGLRCLRLLRAGKTLDMTATIDVVSGPAYESYNVVGEIKGTKKPEEFVVIGAHLDSWELGQGALDNGCNVALVIDLARQIKRLELKPLRTIRFALFN
ncbi:peptidase M28, partial [candidate division KSB1 bacterium]|nr:peptidase M28 [candidate division KSB1 bacterium]